MSYSIHSHGAMATPARPSIETPHLDQVIRDLRKSKTGADGKAPDLSDFRIVSKTALFGPGVKLKAPADAVGDQRVSEGGTRTAALIDKDCKALALPSLGTGLVGAMRVKGQTLFPQLEKAAAWVRVAKDLSNDPSLLGLADHNPRRLHPRIQEAVTELARQDLQPEEFGPTATALVSRMLSNPNESASYIVSSALKTLREPTAPEAQLFESTTDRKSAGKEHNYPRRNRVSLHPSPLHPHKASPIRPAPRADGQATTQTPGTSSLSSSDPTGGTSSSSSSVTPQVRSTHSSTHDASSQSTTPAIAQPQPPGTETTEQPGTTRARAEALIRKDSRRFGVQSEAEIHRLAELAVRDAGRRGCAIEDSTRLALAAAHSMNPKAILASTVSTRYAPQELAPFVQALIELRKEQLTGSRPEGLS